MREMWNTAKYRLLCYFNGYSFVMPCIVICIFMRFMYSVKPMDVVSGCLITVPFLFLLMVWVGMGEMNRENRVMEQILELRVHKTWAYYAGKVLFLFFLSLLAATICTIWPFIQNLVVRGTFFKREYLPDDLVNSFLLNLSSSYAGVMLGSFLHSDICRDRKMAIALTVSAALLAVTKGMIISEKPLLRYFLWFLPDVLRPAMQYGNAEYFKIGVSFGCFAVLMLCAVMYGVIGSLWQYKRRV